MRAEVLPVFAGGLLETAARAFEREPVDQWLEEEILEGVGLFVQLRSTLRFSRKALERDLDLGSEAWSFVARHQPVADGLKRFLAAVALPRLALDAASERAELAPLAAEIAAAEAEGRILHDRLSEALQKATALLPSIDWKKLEAEIEADRKAGRFVTLETFEDLFGETPDGA